MSEGQIALRNMAEFLIFFQGCAFAFVCGIAYAAWIECRGKTEKVVFSVFFLLSIGFCFYMLADSVYQLGFMK